MIRKHYISVLLVVGLALIGAALLWFESELLWKAQEMNLWLSSSMFLRQQMVVAGGLLTWVGTLFTQFFFYPWLGVALLCCWWLLLMWLTHRTFRIQRAWNMILLLPVALLLITIVDMGYWIYLLKLQGHFFVTTIGTTVAVALLWAYRAVVEQSRTKVTMVLRAVFIAVTCIVGYPLLGIYALVAALLMGLWSWRLTSTDRKQQALTDSVVAVVSVVAVPLLFYRYVYYETSIENIYRVGLPLYTVTESYPSFYIPFVLLALFYGALTLMSTDSKNSLPERRAKREPVFSFLFSLLLALSIYFSWYKDGNFHHELTMQHAIARLDWQGVLNEAAKQKEEPTRAIVMMRNLALARLGRQGDEMYRYRNGSKKSNAPFTMRLLIVAGPLIYYHYGLPNCCTRLSMEMGVEYGWRVEYYKYLARCAILNDEQQLARKYLGILRQTLFFDRWAENVGKLIGHEDLICSHPETAFITHMMHYDNHLTSDRGFVERLLMQELSVSTYADDPIFQEQTLLASMWTKDVKLFWTHLIDYAKLHPDVQIPVHYQEAALLYGSLEGRKDLDSWPFDPSVRESYRSFREITPHYENMEVATVREALYPLFGSTFYYDYYLMNNLPQW